MTAGKTAFFGIIFDKSWRGVTVAFEAHNLLVVGSTPTSATNSSLDTGGSHYIEKIGMNQCCSGKQSINYRQPEKRGECLNL